MKSKLVIFSSFALLAFLPVLVLAQQPAPGTTDLPGLLRVIETVSRWIFTFLLVIVVLMVLWAAFTFVTAGGDPSKVAEARSRIVYAVVGLIVALLAWSVPVIVRNVVGL